MPPYQPTGTDSDADPQPSVLEAVADPPTGTATADSEAAAYPPLTILTRRRRRPGCLVQVGNCIELDTVGRLFEPYRWRPCGVTWDFGPEQSW